MKEYYSESQIADIFSISVKNIQKKIEDKHLFKIIEGEKYYHYSQIQSLKSFNKSNWENFINHKNNNYRNYTSVEIFSGAGGLALGLENAGFNHIMLNDFNPHAIKTLNKNRKNWNVINKDISTLSFLDYVGADVLCGGFPCQAFSYIGKGLGFADIRGTLFYHYARALSEIKPKFFIAENVKGLLSHDKGRTIQVIYEEFKKQGYKVLDPKLFNTLFYKVPQKRERVIIIGVREDIYKENVLFEDPKMYYQILNLKDTFLKGILYDKDVPLSNEIRYPIKKEKFLKLIPEGGNWRSLTIDKQKEYMGGSFGNGGGQTGVAKRLSMDKPSLTLLCSPMQKQTERCHPIETRPLTIRESARIQTFPDDWVFEGPIAEQYKQVGNAVPVNFAEAIGKAMINYMNKMID